MASSGGSGGWDVKGLDKLIHGLKLAGDRADKVVAAALFQEAQLVMRKSQQEVPVKDGFLKASGEVEPPKLTAGRVVVTMGYGGAAQEYALYVHNSPYEKNWTKAGTKSHFLSDPLTAAIPHIQVTLMRRIGRMMSAGGVS